MDENRATERPEEVHQHSGWLIPLAFLGVIAVLAALFLMYDLRPGMGPRNGGRTADDTPIAFSLRGSQLVVPGNYLDGGESRDGGERDFLHLTALLPDFEGYSEEKAGLFAGNAPDSPLVRLLFKSDELALDARSRMERIYRPYLQDIAGKPGSFGLTQYVFRPDSGYGRQDLFAGTAGGQLVLLLCEREAPDLISPTCFAADRPVAPNLSFSYRFKRAYLGRWQEVVAGADRLVERLRAP